MRHRLVPVAVAVRFARRIIGVVLVPMMLVVAVQMLVLERLMNVLVLVPFGHMKPHASLL